MSSLKFIVLMDVGLFCFFFSLLALLALNPRERKVGNEIIMQGTEGREIKFANMNEFGRSETS